MHASAMEIGGQKMNLKIRYMLIFQTTQWMGNGSLDGSKMGL